MGSDFSNVITIPLFGGYALYPTILTQFNGFPRHIGLPQHKHVHGS
jgi:hypothetical protein